MALIVSDPRASTVDLNRLISMLAISCAFDTSNRFCSVKKLISASLAFKSLSNSASDSIRAASTLSLAASTAASDSILADSARDWASATMI